MQQTDQREVSVEPIKPMSTIYAALVIALIVLIALGNVFALEISEYRFRATVLVFIGSVLLMLLGAEIARVLYKAGMTPIGFIGFLTFNLLFGAILFAVFSDIVGMSARPEVQPLIGGYLVFGIVWYIIIVLLEIIAWFRRRKQT
ncbi:MAG: hypothetical protein K9W43_10185 [Candidatus Thorarchaeota archaeon]|nr:hypothetical protein [Candidatus Thorarchaeota archaeon]